MTLTTTYAKQFKRTRPIPWHALHMKVEKVEHVRIQHSMIRAAMVTLRTTIGKEERELMLASPAPIRMKRAEVVNERTTTGKDQRELMLASLAPIPAASTRKGLYTRPHRNI